MKVFSLLSLDRNLANIKCTRISKHSLPCTAMRATPHLAIRVWSIVYMCMSFARASIQINVNAPHFLSIISALEQAELIQLGMPFNGLSDAELLFGYKEIVLYYETQVRNNRKGFNKKELDKFLTDIHGQVLCKMNTLYSYNCLLGKVNKSFIHFYASNYDIPLFIYGLRNAYAHANICKQLIGNRYYLCFYNYFGNRYRMVGQVQFSYFKELILTLKTARRA